MVVETGTWKNQTKALTKESAFLPQVKKHFLYNDQIKGKLLLEGIKKQFTPQLLKSFNATERWR